MSMGDFWSHFFSRNVTLLCVLTLPDAGHSDNWSALRIYGLRCVGLAGSLPRVTVIDDRLIDIGLFNP